MTKHQSFVQADNIVFFGHSQSCPKYPKQYVYNIVAIISKKRRGIKLILLHADKYQTIPQVDTVTLDGYGKASPNYPL